MSALDKGLILAQNFNQGGTGAGGVENVTGALDNLSSIVVTVGASVAILAFSIAVVMLIFTLKRGGSIGQSFSGIGIILLGAVLLGLGAAAVGWAINIGGSLA